MRRKERRRKQRVTLRFRRREELKNRLKGWGLRSAIGLLVLSLTLGIINQSDSFLGDFLRRHTPTVDVRAPQTLPGQPVTLEWPTRRWWLWVPGVSLAAERRLRQKNMAIQKVRFEKRFSANRIVAWIEPRRPFLRWGAMGLDREGVVFPILSDRWNQLPVAHFSPELAKSVIARWIEKIAHHELFWSQVVGVSDDKHGNFLIDLKTGARINWGEPQAEGVSSKLAALTNVLEDVHQHLGGTAQADLRFFDQGRIIIRPKTAASR